MAEENRVLESGVELSQSLLWNLQIAIFKKFGIDAWTKKGVPSYMTSNPLTAHQYAEVAVGFLRDYLARDPNSFHVKDKPFYIFDLGAGSGRFAHIFFKEFLSMVAMLPQFKEMHFCYVLTDIAEANLAFCRQHSYLKRYFEQGLMDLASFHHAQETPLELELTKKTLSKGTLSHPSIVIANYFFDTVPMDLFRADQGQLLEGLIHSELPLACGDMEKDDPVLLEKLRYYYDYRPRVKPPYDSDPLLSQLVIDYSLQSEGAPFTVPVGAIAAIKYFQELSTGRMLLLAGDQGYATHDQVKEGGEPRLALHGSFSIPVNYHFLQMYFERAGGRGWLCRDSDVLFQVFAAAFDSQCMPFDETAFAYHQSVERFSPKDYWKLSSQLAEESAAAPTLETILPLLKLGDWDPMNFYASFNAIRAQLPDASQKVQEELRQAIHAIWDHFYPIQPLEGEFVMNLGVLLFEMKHYAEALALFQRSLVLTGENKTVYHNMAACYLALFNAEAARRCIEKIKELEKDND